MAIRYSRHPREGGDPYRAIRAWPDMGPRLCGGDSLWHVWLHRIGVSLVLLCSLFMMSAHAASIDKPLADAAKEQMARSVFHELRCVVCEGQSLADSNATLALQMRAHVRELVAEGKSEAEVLEFFRARYGEQILMTPPMGPKTVLLWFAPLLLLSLGGVLVWRFTRHGGSQ